MKLQLGSFRYRYSCDPTVAPEGKGKETRRYSQILLYTEAVIHSKYFFLSRIIDSLVIKKEEIIHFMTLLHPRVFEDIPWYEKAIDI